MTILERDDPDEVVLSNCNMTVYLCTLFTDDYKLTTQKISLWLLYSIDELKLVIKFIIIIALSGIKFML